MVDSYLGKGDVIIRKHAVLGTEKDLFTDTTKNDINLMAKRYPLRCV